MKLLVVLLAVASLTSALPIYSNWDFYELHTQKHTGQQCAETRDSDTVCRSAKVISKGQPMYAHVCPESSKSVRYYYTAYMFIVHVSVPIFYYLSVIKAYINLN